MQDHAYMEGMHDGQMYDSGVMCCDMCGDMGGMGDMGGDMGGF